MAIYCYVDLEDGTRFQSEQHGLEKTENVRRDYKTELNSHSVFIPMHMSSKNTSNKSDFLPSAKDFENHGDPTGENGMKEWKDTHQVVGSRWI